MNTSIYLDNSATTQVRPEVVEAMVPYLGKIWGNPSSIHQFGRQAAEALSSARQQVAQLLNCLPEEIYFSPCGTYSNNTAIVGRARYVEANRLGRHMITSAIEHPAVLGPARHLEAQGWDVTYLPVSSQGIVNPEDLRRSISSNTSIISIMWANNEIGTVQPVAQLAQVANAAGVYFHTDAVQCVGKLPLDMTAVPASSLSLSGHKFHAPKGIGVLYVRQGVNLMPLVWGGGQEQGLFPGTEALPNIVGIGLAAQLATQELDGNMSSLRQMQQVFLDELLSVPGVRLTGAQDIEHRLPGHVSLSIEGGDGEALVLKADLKGICISAGSACHKGVKSPSHIISAIGLPARDALGTVRISAGRFNTTVECQRAARSLASILSNLNSNTPKACPSLS